MAEVAEVGDGTNVIKAAAPASEVKEVAVQEYTDQEQRAMEQGWNPDWEGDPDQKRTAREFLDRGELLGKIKSQSSELKQIKQTLDGLSAHNKSVYTAGYEKALTDLRAAKAEAVTNSDGARVVQLDDAIDQTRKAIADLKAQPVATQPQGQSQEFIDFQENSSWYGTDKKMKSWAHGEAIEFAKTHNDATEKQVYDYLSKEVRKEYPERFQRKGPPNPDGEGRSTGGNNTPSASGSKAFDTLMSQLPEEAVRVAKDFVKRGLITKEKYVEDWNAVGQGR